LKGICASNWTITKNHRMMHGQQNVKKKRLLQIGAEDDGNILQWHVCRVGIAMSMLC